MGIQSTNTNEPTDFEALRNAFRVGGGANSLAVAEYLLQELARPENTGPDAEAARAILRQQCPAEPPF